MRLKNKILFLSLAVFLIMPFFVSIARADTLGQTTQFFIDSKYDESSRTSVSATLHYISAHAYFYVEDGFYNRISQASRENLPRWLNSLAAEFENNIYSFETNFWGSEYSPGVDNDPRVTILLSPLVDTAGGYFDTGNENLKIKDPASNQREMVYLNSNIVSNTKRISSFLAHEFQHLIGFNQKEILRNVSDDIWLNELRSEYSSTLLGYNDLFDGSNLQKRVKAFLDFPSDSLTEWKNQAADYGAIAVFGEYLAEHFGSTVLVDSLKSGRTGIESINEALLKNNYSVNFEEIFRNWAIANILNDAAVNSNFGYFKEGLRQNIKVEPTRIISGIDDVTTFIHNGQIKDWQPQWFWVSGFLPGKKQVLEIAFSGDGLESMKAVLIAFSNDGKKQFQSAELGKGNKIYLDNLSGIEKVIFIPYKTGKTESFGDSEPVSNFAFSLQRLEQLPKELYPIIYPTPVPTPSASSGQASSPQATPAPSFTPMPSPAPVSGKPDMPAKFPDGALLRARGGIKVYIVNNGWKRHIVSPDIFNFYGHLGFNKVIEVEPELVNSYPESKLIRFEGGKKIYEIDKSNVKRWLNMNPDQFTASGRKWDAVFVINDKELNFYKTGVPIAR